MKREPPGAATRPGIPAVIGGEDVNGRYSITVAGHLKALVKLTRVNAPRRWTTICVASPLSPDVWLEVHHPELRTEILHELRSVDLETASALYTARTGTCGACGRPAATDHNGCMARKFDTDKPRASVPEVLR